MAFGKGNNTSQANLKQTAYNVAATVVSSMITTGLIADPSDVDAALGKYVGIVFDDLAATPPGIPSGGSYPASSGGGGSVEGELDPGTLKLKFGNHKDKTIAEVYAEDPAYVTEFLAKKTNNDFIRSRAVLFLQKQGVSS